MDSRTSRKTSFSYCIPPTKADFQPTQNTLTYDPMMADIVISHQFDGALVAYRKQAYDMLRMALFTII